MNIASYIQIDIIPVIILILLYTNSRAKFSNIRNARRFQLQTLLVIAILLVDASVWYMNESDRQFSVNLFWFMNILYFLLTEVISYCWFLYTFHQIYGETLTEKQKKRLQWGKLPLLFLCIFIILSPWTHAVFYVDSVTVEYCRGPLHLVQAIGGFGYILAAAALALYNYRRETMLVRKTEYLFLALIILFPLLGGLLQTCNMNLLFLWPFSAVALFLLYSNFQKTQISIDDLTHLNNRGSFEQYLVRMSQQNGNDWYLLFIDIDKFKQINDKYGHVEGDRALKLVARLLRNTLGATNAFLSRYGGDEFAVILESDSETEIQQIIACLNSQLRQSCEENKLPYTLHLSVGYAKYDRESMDTLDQLTHQADVQMYKQKQINHSTYR